MDGIKYTGNYSKQGGDYGNYGADPNPVTVKGAKKGQDKPRKPSIAKDSCLLYTSPSPRDGLLSRMPSSA